MLPPSEKGALLTFANNGVLPATVRVRIANQGFLPGQTAYLYYYNSTLGKLEILANSALTVDQDGYVSIVIDHTSQYVILKKQVPAIQPIQLDTGSRLTVKAGRTYQFKITASAMPSFVSGNGSVFRIASVDSKGSDYFFKFTAVGKPGNSAGFYVNGEKTPRTIGTIVK